jgi:hypothetical protein
VLVFEASGSDAVADRLLGCLPLVRSSGQRVELRDARNQAKAKVSPTVVPPLVGTGGGEVARGVERSRVVDPTRGNSPV